MRYRPAARRVLSLSRQRAACLPLRRLLGYIVERYTTTFAAAVASGYGRN